MCAHASPPPPRGKIKKNTDSSKWGNIPEWVTAITSAISCIAVILAYSSYKIENYNSALEDNKTIAKDYTTYYADSQCLGWCIGTLKRHLEDTEKWDHVPASNYFQLYDNLFTSPDMTIYNASIAIDAVGGTSDNKDTPRIQPINNTKIASIILAEHGNYISTLRNVRGDNDAFSGISSLVNAPLWPDKAGDVAFADFRDHLKEKKLCRQGFHGGYNQKCRSTCEAAIRQSLSHDIIVRAISCKDDLAPMLDRGCDITQPLKAPPPCGEAQ